MDSTHVGVPYSAAARSVLFRRHQISAMAPIIGKKVAKGPAKTKAKVFTIDCR